MYKSLTFWFILFFCLNRAATAQTPQYFDGPVGIGIQAPSFLLHVNGNSRYHNTAHFGETYDPLTYGKGLQIVRPADQEDNAFHMSFIRSGMSVVGMGFLRNSSVFGIQHAGNNTFNQGFFLSPAGYLGVGTSTPEYPLDVAGMARIQSTSLFLNNSGILYSDQNNVALFTDGGYVFANKNNTAPRAIIDPAGGFHLYTNGVEGIHFSPAGNSIIKSGNLTIGNTNPDNYKLAVEGIIGAKKIKVTQQGWADFVFDPAYLLPTLEAVETHIREKRHLPGIPSAAEVAQQGLDIGDMQQKQMQKIEELMLYVIAQQKKIAEQQQLIADQQATIAEHGKILEELKKSLKN